MNLDDFKVSKLKTKYQKLRFVLVILALLTSGFLIWKSKIIFSNFHIVNYERWFLLKNQEWWIESGQASVWLSDSKYNKTFQNYRRITTFIGSIIGAFLFYYILKLIEWINKEDKL